MNRKIRVGAVNYLNTRPLIYGFEQGEMAGLADLIVAYPSKIATLLANDEIDVGLVPVAVIPELKEYHIISDYCIGCDGEVASVCLFSDVPLAQIDHILLDYQSRTSVELLKLLVKKYWKIDPAFLTTTNDYRKDITNTTGGLVIGDRALEQRNTSKYHYDLGAEWKKYTGLPFVFAAWISNKKLDPIFIDAFNRANETGLQQIDTVVKENPFEAFDLQAYYTQYIRYQLDDKARRGLEVFLEMLSKDRQ